MRRRLALMLMVVMWAVPPVPSRAVAPVPAPGGLIQLAGPLGCLGGIAFPELGIPDDHCTPLGGWTGQDTIVFAGPARSVTAALSPDGRFLYAASRGQQLHGRRHHYDSAIVVLARDPGDGSLHELDGEEGCVSELRRHQCAGGRSLDHISALAVSPDGRNLYAVANLSSGVAVFRRDPEGGTLAQLPGQAGCVRRHPGTERCARGRALGNPDSVLVSADGRNVYVGGNFGDGTTIAAFERNADTGALRQLTGSAACLASRLAADAAGCAPIRGLTFFDVPSQSPDARFLYWSNKYGNGPVLGLARDPTTGTLTPLGPLCAACKPTPPAGTLAISPDGSSAYVFAGQNGVVSAFDRDQATGRLSPAAIPVAFRCVPTTRCDAGTMKIDETGTTAYLVSGRAILALQRDPSNDALAAVPGQPGCIAAVRRHQCVRGRALDDPTDLLLPTDGRNAYSVSEHSIAEFQRTGS
jgi:6-phosphogluconolactonase (cycloisomerase 2 family)